MIQRVNSNDVDYKKFNALLERHEFDIFSDSAYYDVLCPFWCLLVLDDYRGALIIPYNQKINLSWAVTPLFYRASSWLGAWSEEQKSEAIFLLQKEFKSGVLNLERTSQISNVRKHQIIRPENYSLEKYSTLAKRMIKKPEGQGVVYVNELDIQVFVQFLKDELGKRVDGINESSMDLFEKLLHSLGKADLLRFEGAVIGGQLVGGILTVEKNGKHLYLKGTATSDAKKKGVFYTLMHRAIGRAVAKKAIFDFGGSEVTGVAQFNHNFGAEDAEYSILSWGKKPWLYSIYVKIKKLWK